MREIIDENSMIEDLGDTQLLQELDSINRDRMDE